MEDQRHRKKYNRMRETRAAKGDDTKRVMSKDQGESSSRSEPNRVERGLRKRSSEKEDMRVMIQQEMKKQRRDQNPDDDDWVINLVKTPFTRWITETNPPSRFVAPKCDLYDGTTDPTEHVINYHNVMIPLSLSEDRKKTMMCNIFASSLKGVALTWFNGLKVESISSFEELVKLFRAQFTSSIQVRKEANYLFTIRQRR